MLEASPCVKGSAKATMRAAALVEPGRFEMVEAAIPEPGPNQVRVCLEGCGVCASNLPPFEGREWFSYPMVPGALGHEGWGVVDATGRDVRSFSEGDRVAFLSDGAYAEYGVADESAAVHLPDALDGLPFPGEPLGCAVNIFRRSEIAPGTTVAIVGIGFLGTLLAQMAAREGARVIAIGRRPFALELARKAGAEAALPMEDHGQILEQVKDLTDGRFCDVVVEAVGKQWPLDLAGEITRERGRLVVAGYHQDGPRQVNMQLWNWRGLDVVNAHEREERVYVDGIREAARQVAAGELDVMPLMTHRYPLERLAEALRDTSERPAGFMKALVVNPGDNGAGEATPAATSGGRQ
jgi:threonine dehydrogenase-like Zn-dependent dehydrogenase